MIPSATPASSRRLVDRWRRAKRSRIKVISSAPKMAHRPSAQPGKTPLPSRTAAISPTPAPLETPSSPGSASGFSNNACIIAPESASAAPTSSTARVRGRRICQINSWPLALSHSPGGIHCSPAHRLISRVTSSNSVNPKSQRRLRRC